MQYAMDLAFGGGAFRRRARQPELMSYVIGVFPSVANPISDNLVLHVGVGSPRHAAP
jgi:hypothetical protein